MRITSEAVVRAAAGCFAAGMAAPLVPQLPLTAAPLLMLASVALAETAIAMDARRT